MSAINKLALFCLIVFFIGAVFMMGFNFNKSKERDALEQIDVAKNPHLITETLSSLREVLENRMLDADDVNPPPRVRSMSFGDVFQKLKEQGRSIEVEVVAVREFEKAIDNLSEAIRKLREVSTF